MDRYSKAHQLLLLNAMMNARLKPAPTYAQNGMCNNSNGSPVVLLMESASRQNFAAVKMNKIVGGLNWYLLDRG